MSSPAQIVANRANAQLSTGPATPTGQAKSSLNAVKTGLTGHTVLLPADDAAAYEHHVHQYFEYHQPVGEDEKNLVQSLADTQWRLLRIPSLEMGIYALGSIEFASRFENEDAAVRAALIEAHIFITYQRQLNNLSIQEGRLRRQREKDGADLKDMQAKRQQRMDVQLASAVELYKQAQPEGKPFDPAEFGFEFSIDQVRQRLVRDDARKAGHSASMAEILSKRAA